ncbi:unannotated protein [freshwater metagenome]|uniref:Unannotated protein n=1 Tax=freshwater metagenome TaxID=449393 RepID=A0A6J7IZP5_9ZZZZ|nr:hypothetical protein [Actinomycetota bacterium]
MNVPHLFPTAVAVATLALVATGCGLDTSEDVVGAEVDAARDAAVVPGVANPGVATTNPAPTGAAGAASAAGREPTSTTSTPPIAGPASTSSTASTTGPGAPTARVPAADPAASFAGPGATTAGLTSSTTGTPTAAPDAGTPTTSPATGTSTPASAPSIRLHTPNLVGLPASAAPLRLGATGFRSEYGRRYDVVRWSGRTVVLRAGHRADRPVTAQTPAHPVAVRPGDVVATATTRTPVPDGRRPRLITVRWGTLRMDGATLEIGGLGRMDDCDRLDHVQLGPRGGASRTVRVWVIAPPAEPRAACTRWQPRTIRLRPGAGWNRDTVAVDVAADRR